MNTHPDPRVYAAARALAACVGTPKEWQLWMSEARTALQAADTIDALREETL